MSNDTDTERTVMHRLREHSAARKVLLTLVVGMLLISGVAPLGTVDTTAAQPNAAVSYVYTAESGQSVRKFYESNLTQANSVSLGVQLRSVAVTENYVFAGGTDGVIYKVDKSDMTVVNSKNIHNGQNIFDMMVIDSGIVTGGFDGNATVVNPDDLTVQHRADVTGSVDRVYSITQGPNGSLYFGSFVKITKTDTSLSIIDELGTSAEVVDLTFYEGSLISAEGDGYVRKYATDPLTQVAQNQVSGQIQEGVAVVNGSLFEGGRGGTLRKLDSSLNVLDSTAVGYDINSLASNGEYVYSGGDGGEVEKYSDGLALLSQASGSGIIHGIAFTPVSDAPGPSPTQSDLMLDVREYLQPNQTVPYTVLWNETNTTTGESTIQEVTANATVTSGNLSLVTVNQTAFTVTGDATNSGYVNVTANYTTDSGDNINTTKRIFVGELTVENLEELPNNTWRFAALFGGGSDPGEIIGDGFMFLLVIATLGAVAGARFTSSFGGLAFGTVLITMGWFAGYVSYGMAAVSVFIALFIGLNVAANIDYMGGGMRR